MANELSRVGDRLTRARERTWNGATSLLLPIGGSREARREPTRVPASKDREREREARSDAGADKKRPPTTLVAIHVEVRHPTEDAVEDTARFVDAHVDDVAQAHQHEFAIEDEAAAPVEQTHEADGLAQPVFALPALARGSGTNKQQARPAVAVHLVAARALSAYLAHQTFAGPAESRLIDVRV